MYSWNKFCTFFFYKKVTHKLDLSIFSNLNTKITVLDFPIVYISICFRYILTFPFSSSSQGQGERGLPLPRLPQPCLQPRGGSHNHGATGGHFLGARQYAHAGEQIIRLRNTLFINRYIIWLIITQAIEWNTYLILIISDNNNLLIKEWFKEINLVSKNNCNNL